LVWVGGTRIRRISLTRKQSGDPRLVNANGVCLIRARNPEEIRAIRVPVIRVSLTLTGSA